MEFGYKQTMDYLIQTRTATGNTDHVLIEAGSMKHAKRKMRQHLRDSDAAEAIVVTSIKKNGEPGQAGDGQLPNEDQDIKEVINRLVEEG